MKILVTSDLHGILPKIEEPFDLLLICGDICPAHDHYYKYQLEWFMNEFADWINTLPFNPDPLYEPFSKVIMTWGNHDMVGERINKNDLHEFYKKTFNRVVVLKNEEYSYEYIDDKGIASLRIFGTPYCKIFGNWAFMVSNEKLKEKYSEIPLNCDIVISHDSPSINNLGTIQEGWQKGINAGNTILAEEIKIKKPKYFFSGHIHSGNHNFEDIDGTMMANVSLVNEQYRPVYDILKFEI